jgi:hypothetical protein
MGLLIDIDPKDSVPPHGFFVFNVHHAAGLELRDFAPASNDNYAAGNAFFINEFLQYRPRVGKCFRREAHLLGTCSRQFVADKDRGQTTCQ